MIQDNVIGLTHGLYQFLQRSIASHEPTFVDGIHGSTNGPVAA